jgi:hypothetical protein
MLLCFMYPAIPFDPPKEDKPSIQVQQIIEAVKNAREKGVEHWQVNMNITPEGVTLIDYFPLKLGLLDPLLQ